MITLPLGFKLYRTSFRVRMVTAWGGKWRYGGLIMAFGWILSIPGWPPSIQREEARAREAALEELSRMMRH